MTVRQTLKALLQAGKYQELLQTAERRKPSVNEQAHVIGALCFTGQGSEAQLLFNILAEKISLEAKTDARFFLAVPLCRQFAAHEALQLLRKARREARDSKTAAFYIYQGYAILLFYSRKMRFAQAMAQKALE